MNSSLSDPYLCTKTNWRWLSVMTAKGLQKAKYKVCKIWNSHQYCNLDLQTKNIYCILRKSPEERREKKRTDLSLGRKTDDNGIGLVHVQRSTCYIHPFNSWKENLNMFSKVIKVCKCWYLGEIKPHVLRVQFHIEMRCLNQSKEEENLSWEKWWESRCKWSGGIG